MTLGDKIAIMKQGVIQQVASPKETYDQPANMFVAGFMGSPPMNFLPVEAVFLENCWHLKAESFDLSLPQSIAVPLPEKIIVGIRPEDFSISDNHCVNALQASVSVTEHIGSALIVHGYCGKNQIIASLAPHHKVEHDATLTLAVAFENLHIFDAKTELAVIS